MGFFVTNVLLAGGQGFFFSGISRKTQIKKKNVSVQMKFRFFVKWKLMFTLIVVYGNATVLHVCLLVRYMQSLILICNLLQSDHSFFGC